MSLFKAREWWHAQGAANEEFDGASICIGHIDNDAAARVITGSLQGHLRIYAPKQRGYQAEDLLLEAELDHAILQLECGRFSAAGGIQLAVLHPRKLVVYNVQAMGTSYLQLTKLYEHQLEHTAANFVYGAFGGVQGSDHMAVQSYDGQLSLFEGETAAFSRFLPNFLIPGPLAYIEPADSFVTCGAGFELECYKYKVLATASGDKPAAAGAKEMSGHQTAKRVQADWRLVLGEAAVEIRSGRVSSGLQAFQADIIVLCEHNVFVVSSQGQITFQKRLEYHPACCTTYPVPGAKQPGGPENLLVATHHRALLVYRQAVLSWAARLDALPIAVRVADIAGQRGMIVTLDGTGRVAVSYLGTDPMLTPVGLSEGKALDYEAMAREHRQLAIVIRDAGTGQRVEPLDRLIMRVQVPQALDAGGIGPPPPAADEEEMRDWLRAGGGGRAITARLLLKYDGPGGGGGVDGVLLTIRTPEGVSLEETSISVPMVSATDPCYIPLTFTTSAVGPGVEGLVPASSTATVVASYTNPAGEPRAQRLDVELPMSLFCTLVPPVKNATFKITIATNRAPPLMTAVFEDMVATTSASNPGYLSSLANASGGPGGGANVLSFQYPSGPDVTIVVSKTGGRYRLHSDSFEAMWLVLQELCKRLHVYYGEAELQSPAPEGPFAVSFEEMLPIDDFFEVVDVHFQLRLRAATQRQQLEDRAVQFRSIQKRLLMRFKDKNPSALNQLDYLLEETYNGVIDLGTSLELTLKQLKTAGQKLAGSVQLVLQLVRYRFGMSEREFKLLRSCLSPQVEEDGGEVGWEEYTEVAMTHLLRTALAKSAKEAAVTVAPLAAAKDTLKLKKHLSLVLERLGRGMRLAVEADEEEERAEAAAAAAAAAALRKPSRSSRSSSTSRSAPGGGGGGGDPRSHEGRAAEGDNGGAVRETVVEEDEGEAAEVAAQEEVDEDADGPRPQDADEEEDDGGGGWPHGANGGNDDDDAASVEMDAAHDA